MNNPSATPRNEFLIMLTIVLGFMGAFCFQMVSIIFFAPDFSADFPIYSEACVFLLQASGACLIIGFTVIAMKAEEERQILAAAGFTAQAIAFGLSILSMFDIIDVSSIDEYVDFYRISVSSNFLYFPALLLIATYSPFRKWIRIYGFAASTPLMISTAMFLTGTRDFHLLENISNLGYGLISITYVFWSANIFLNYNKAKKARP